MVRCGAMRYGGGGVEVAMWEWARVWVVSVG